MCIGRFVCGVVITAIFYRILTVKLRRRQRPIRRPCSRRCACIGLMRTSWFPFILAAVRRRFCRRRHWWKRLILFGKPLLCARTRRLRWNVIQPRRTRPICASCGRLVLTAFLWARKVFRTLNCGGWAGRTMRRLSNRRWLMRARPALKI